MAVYKNINKTRLKQLDPRTSYVSIVSDFKNGHDFLFLRFISMVKTIPNIGKRMTAQLKW